MKNIFKFIVHGFLILIPTIFHSSLSHAEVSFRVMPEFPYSDEEFFLIDKELKNTKKSTKFIINMGSKTDRPNPTNLDFSCDEERYKNLHDLLKQSTVPVFIVPGANVYWPCHDELKLNPLWENIFLSLKKTGSMNF